MNVESAIELISTIIYRPGWQFVGDDHRGRFEGAITLTISYPSRNTNRDQAAVGYCERIDTYAKFPMVVADCDEVLLFRRVLDKILAIEAHEAREFFRIMPTNWAPFHPHRVGGMQRWGDVTNDLTFGIT